MFLADLHIHTTFSDGQLTIPQIVDLYGSKGFGAIAITDHLCEKNTFLGKAARYLDRTLTPETFPFYLSLIESEAARAWDQYRMLVIPGYEITKNYLSNHRSAHLLALGVSQFVPADGDIAETADRIRNTGAFSIAAHPVSTRKVEKQTYHIWDRRDELSTKIDAWEVASGPYFFDEVAAARLPLIANSDFHRPNHMRSWKTVFQCERKTEVIFQAIRNQDLEFKFYYDDASHFSMHALLTGRFSPSLVGDVLSPTAI